MEDGDHSAPPASESSAVSSQLPGKADRESSEPGPFPPSSSQAYPTTSPDLHYVIRPPFPVHIRRSSY